ncbi:hypothetical protein [Pseudomonas sp. EMN2]|uniref:hypothetical protein n=1 Tax=Pseudomonas sp. EMN2 TaxID=2615212 RepID=UPI00129B04C9|nr:hypothetical protein [Pseudomonas sp. EMN2]
MTSNLAQDQAAAAPDTEYGPTPGCKQCTEAQECGLTFCPECDAEFCEDTTGDGVRADAAPMDGLCADGAHEFVPFQQGCSKCGEPYRSESSTVADADPYDDMGQERAAIARLPGPAVEPLCMSCYDKGVVIGEDGETSCPHCLQVTPADRGLPGVSAAGALHGATGLIAFRFAETVVVAAYTPEQALAVLSSDTAYQCFGLADALPCTDTQLDAVQTCTSHQPAPTLRQRLSNVKEPCWLQDWDGFCPPMPPSVWAELECQSDSATT